MAKQGLRCARTALYRTIILGTVGQLPGSGIPSDGGGGGGESEGPHYHSMTMFPIMYTEIIVYKNLSFILEAFHIF